MKRRDLLKLSLAAGAAAATTGTRAADAGCAADGTPAQFVPKRPADPAAHENDLEKFPKCPYCGMERRQFHHSRMLIQYSDDLADGTCSLHCAALSLGLNVDREPKAVWVGDNAVAGEPTLLTDADKATFLIGSRIKGVMTRRSKVAYSKADAAKATQAAEGGELADFGQALAAAYQDMADDVRMIRKVREERRRRVPAKPAV